VSPSVETTYRRLAPFHDVLYGVGLQHGRNRAMTRLQPRPGEWILEVGVGTGFGTVRYPRSCRVAAVDLSASMLARARARVERRALHHVGLCRMDAACMAFPAGRFDAVYAPYVINVVPEPLAFVREMRRVCRPGGRLVFLNHFASDDREPRATRVAGRVATWVTGASWSLDLASFLEDSGLTILSIESVNLRVSSIVVCRNESVFELSVAGDQPQRTLRTQRCSNSKPQ
jgi:phosphatidylethanolamine/phosphatidyl-N-methylethanolamine N-methyltransferase